VGSHLSTAFFVTNLTLILDAFYSPFLILSRIDLSSLVVKLTHRLTNQTK
jgi:hypothetical protein